MNYLSEALGQIEGDFGEAVLLRHNENLIYALHDLKGKKQVVLRIHRTRAGFDQSLHLGRRTPLGLRNAEMQLLEQLQRVGLPVQTVLTNRAGERVTQLSDGTPVTFLAWIEGQTGQERAPEADEWLELADYIAGLHAATRTSNLELIRYDLALLERMRQAFKADLQFGAFQPAEYASLESALACISELLQADSTRWSVCHADLSLSNLILHGGRLVPIDFSLSGWAPVAMDFGSLGSYFSDRDLLRSMLARYEERSGYSLPWREVELCFAWQVMLYIAAQGRSASQESWFAAAMERWCRTIFNPLVEGKPILS
jgi:Ser/Thr protein kinase RdoA (MazF antagonist)